MNYGLYLSASGVLTNLYRQDVFANNLANVETTAFKRDVPSISQRDPESVEDHFGYEVSKRLLDRLGGGVLAAQQRIDFGPGPLQKTDRPLDMALESPDAFFTIHALEPGAQQPDLRLTRDGRFSRNAQGYLVTLAGGHRVLDINDQPIRITGEAPVKVDPTGRLYQQGEQFAKIQITAVTDKNQLAKHGENLFRFKDDRDIRTPDRQPTVKVGFIESSGVDPITTLMKLINSTKNVSANGNLIRYHDLLMDKAVNVLGRVA